MKKFLALALSAVMLLSLAACGQKQSDGEQTTGNNTSTESGTIQMETKADLAAAEYLRGGYTPIPADGPEVNLTFGHAATETSDQHAVTLAFKEALEYYSGGKIKVTVYPNSQLGSDSEMIASCVAGDIDLVSQSGSTHSSLVPETIIFDTPFLFTGYDKNAVSELLIDSEFRTLYDEASEKVGLTVLTINAANTMNLTSNRPIRSMEDLKGLKIRVAQVESRMAIWSALGANPTPLAYSELYMALQNGTVEAQDNVLSNVVSASLYEQSKYLFRSEHSSGELEIVMNSAKFHNLPGEYQNLITEISDDITRYDVSLTLAHNEEFYNFLITEGGLEDCVIDETFAAEMKAAAEPAVNKVKGLVGNDALYETLYEELNQL